MSQYPSPYQTPAPFSQVSPYYQGYGYVPLRAAKRAGLLMIVVGGTTVMLGLCAVGVGQALKTTQLPPELTAQLQQIEASGIHASTLFAVMGGIFLFYALLQIVFGFVVRAGSKAGIVLSIIGTSISVLVFGFFLLAGAVNILSHGRPEMLIGMVLWVIPLVLLILQLVWLIGAMRGGGQNALAQQQYQAQYWQYQQNMQAYGYGQPPQAPPGPPSPPTPPVAGA